MSGKSGAARGSQSGKKRKIPPGTKVWREGMLMKMGALHKAWQPRYMVLRGGVWEYYTDFNAWKDGKDPKGQLVVADAKAARSKELEAEKKLGLTFTPAGSERTYLFLCSSFEDQQRWLTALNDAIQAEPSNAATLKPALSTRNRQVSMQIVNPEIDLEGWLMRKGSGIGGVGIKSWTKRYFRLSSVSFSMYKNEKDQKALSTISVANLDNVDYFANKREGNRFDVLSHDEFGSSLMCLYAADAKAALRWCRRIRKAMDDWETTRQMMSMQHRDDVLQRPPMNIAIPELERGPNRSRTASVDVENSAKEDPEEEDTGVTDNMDEVLGQLGTLDFEEAEPQEDPPETDPSVDDEEQKILRDRQRAETGVELEKITHSRRKTAEHIEKRMYAKKEELAKAISAFEDESDDDADSDTQITVSAAQPEEQAFANFRLPSLLDILTQLGMSSYASDFRKYHLSSLDLLDLSPASLSSIIRAKGPRGRLTRYLQPFIREREEVETAQHLKQLERSLERIAADLARVGSSVARLNVAFSPST